LLPALATRNDYASKLRLSDGLEIGKHTIAWTDIEALTRVPRSIHVRYVGGREPGRACAVTDAVGRIGLYFPPAYLSARYDTSGQGGDVYEILQRRRRLERADVATDSSRS
jgi:hypothetical protein